MQNLKKREENLFSNRTLADYFFFSFFLPDVSNVRIYVHPSIPTRSLIFFQLAITVVELNMLSFNEQMQYSESRITIQSIELSRKRINMGSANVGGPFQLPVVQFLRDKMLCLDPYTPKLHSLPDSLYLRISFLRLHSFHGLYRTQK